MTRALFVCLAGSLLLSLAPPAGAAGPPSSGTTRYVVVAGVSAYGEKSGIISRKHAEADARALFSLLTDPARGGTDKASGRLLLGAGAGSEKATRANFLDALEWAASNARPTDEVVIGFFGQGGPIGEGGDRRCYFLADSSFAGRNKDAATEEEVATALKGLKARHLCVFLDVDFTGFEKEKGKPVAEPGLGKAPYREFLGDDGSEDHLPLAGRVAFLATSGLTQSLDLKDRGVFAKAVIDALEGGADATDFKDKDGYEPDGLVTVGELAKYLNKKLPELARANGKTEKEKEQDHWVLSGTGAHFVLATVPEANKARLARLAKLEAIIAGGKLDKPMADEARSLLGRMPRLKNKQEMRKAYQAFVDDPTKFDALKADLAKILAGTRMSQEDAEGFADTVMRAVKLVRSRYIREVGAGKLVTWAVKGLYGYIEEKIPEGLAADLKKAGRLDADDLHLLLAKARRELGKREDLDGQKDLTITIQKMLGNLDPHTNYLDPETRQRMEQDISGNFTGIGVQIRKDVSSDMLLVVSPIKGSPAYKNGEGLWAGDIITRIKREVDSNGDPIADAKERDISTKGMPLNKAVKLITGQAGTMVTLTIRRDGKEEDVSIRRGRIGVDSYMGARRKKNDEWDFVVDRTHKIGYLRLASFSRTSFRDMEAVLKDLLEKEDMKGFVLDLRFNPGGLLDQAVDITNLFIKKDGMIVGIRARGMGAADEEPIPSRPGASLPPFPMACLINGQSASGSEIVAAALQDYRRALIVGERSYGKGSVQKLYDFAIPNPAGGKNLKAEIKLTTATFWRPGPLGKGTGDRNLNKADTSGKEDEAWGVKPDNEKKLSAKERRDLYEALRDAETIERPDGKGKPRAEFKDRQLEFALEYIRGEIKRTAKSPPPGRGE